MLISPGVSTETVDELHNTIIYISIIQVNIKIYLLIEHNQETLHFMVDLLIAGKKWFYLTFLFKK